MSLQEKARAVLDAMEALVNSNAPFVEKRDAVLAEAGPDGRVVLDEFNSWFENVDFGAPQVG